MSVEELTNKVNELEAKNKLLMVYISGLMSVTRLLIANSEVMISRYKKLMDTTGIPQNRIALLFEGTLKQEQAIDKAKVEIKSIIEKLNK